MRLRPHPVKHSSRSVGTVLFPQHWLEGWGIIFPSVGTAALAAWLAIPQGTMPDYLPLPKLAEAELSTTRRELAEAGAFAHAQPLDYDVRAVGEALRQLGRASHAGEDRASTQRGRLRELVQKARAKSGDAPLLALRAVQTQLFQAALGQWERTGVESEELIELGGDFVAFARAHGWWEQPDGTPRRSRSKGAGLRLHLTEMERAALFMTRWTELCAPDDGALALAPVWRLLALRARLRLPIARLNAGDLRLIERVALLDPTYPELLSKGLLYLGLNDLGHAEEALRTHLQQHPNGAYALRARNHLVYAVERMNGDGS